MTDRYTADTINDDALDQLYDGLDGAYRERAHLVALLAAMTEGAVIAPAPDVDEPGWQIVYLKLGGWQASWHIAPRDAELFTRVDHVGAGDPRAQWDGHTTDQKYTRIRQHTRVRHMNRRLGPGREQQPAPGPAATQATEPAQQADADPDDPPVQCWHTEPGTPCDWDVCNQPERLAAGDYGTDPREQH